MNLKNEVKIAFEKIIDLYGFTMKQLNENELVLVKGKFALWFYYYYRDGVGASYLILNKDGVTAKSYSIRDYLRFRRKRFFCQEENICDDAIILRSLAITLENSAQDILRGDSEWLSDYETHYSTTPLAQITADKIWADK